MGQKGRPFCPKMHGMKNRYSRSFLLVAGLAFVMAACVLTNCASKHRMTIIPGMTWEYFPPRYSRIVQRDKIIAEGNDLFISFFEHGFGISGGEKFIYVDMRDNSVDDSGAVDFSAVTAKSYAVFDVTSAMGLYMKLPHREFLGCMQKLRERAASMSFAPNP